LITVLVLTGMFYFILKARKESEQRLKAELDPEKMRLEMQALAREKLAQRDSEPTITYKTDAAPETPPANSPTPSDIRKEQHEEFIEGEPL
jgi:hypothetical protein